MSLPVKIAASFILAVCLAIAIVVIALNEMQRLRGESQQEATHVMPFREDLTSLQVYLQQMSQDNALLQFTPEMSFMERRTYLAVYKKQREGFEELRTKVTALLANTSFSATKQAWDAMQPKLDQWMAADKHMEEAQKRLLASGVEYADGLDNLLRFFEVEQGALVGALEARVLWGTKAPETSHSEIAHCVIFDWLRRFDASRLLYTTSNRPAHFSHTILSDGTHALEYAKNDTLAAELDQMRAPHNLFHRSFTAATKALQEGKQQTALAMLAQVVEANKDMRAHLEKMRAEVWRTVDLEVIVQQAESKVLQQTLTVLHDLNALIAANNVELATSGGLSTGALDATMLKIEWMLGGFLLLSLGMGAFAYRAYAHNRKVMQELDKEREASYAQMHFLFNTSPMGCVMRDAEYNLINCNLAAARLFGLEEQWADMEENAVAFGLENKWEYLERYAELISPDTQPDGTSSRVKAHELFQKTLETGKVSAEWMYQTGTGDPLPVELTILRAEWLGNLAVVYYIRDLRREKALKAAEEQANDRIRTIFDASPYGFLVRDADDEPVQCNQAMLDILGATNLNDLRNERFTQFMPQTQPCGRPSGEVMQENIQRTMETGQEQFEFLHQRPDGTPVPVAMTLVRVHIDGKPGYAGYVRELGEIKTLLAAQEEAYHHLRQVLDAAPFSCHIMDEKGKILDCNAEAISIFNLLDKHDFIARYWNLLPELQPDGQNSLEMARKQIAAATKTDHLRFAWMHRTADGTPLPMEATLVPIMWNQQPVIACYLRPLNLNERRAATRHILLRECIVEWAMPDNTQGEATIVDMGRNGVRVRCDTSRWKTGDHMRLACRKAPFDAILNEVWGRIMWVYGFEAGLAFDAPLGEEPGIAIRVFNEGPSIN